MSKIKGWVKVRLAIWTSFKQYLFHYLHGMKWILSLLTCTALFTSCDNELVVTDNWKDIPVVWALLNKSDTAHYIRLEKAFLDPNTSALDIAQRPDSLYYENATVSLKRVNNGQVFQLQRVNGDLEGYPRDGGVFAQTPNWLYKIKANVINLVIGEKYELVVDRGDGSPVVTAETIILPKPVLRNPVKGSQLSFKRGSLFTIMWNEMPDAGIFDVKIRFHYQERNPVTGNFYIPKSFEWTVVKNLRANETQMQGVDFYNQIKANLDVNVESTRIFDSLDIIIWAGGKDLEEYIRITQANFGITSTQDIPRYTNLSEGVGIFDSRNVSYVTGFRLGAVSLDSLRNSSITGNLNFQ